MRTLLFAIFLILLGSLMAEEVSSPTKPDTNTMRLSFDRDMDTELLKRLLSHRYISLTRGGGPDGSDAIRVAYVGNEQGSERVVVRVPLDFATEAATLSFDVRFDRDFQWVKGGKLHGLGPKRPITGGQERRPDGWSARVTFKKDGYVATYLYDQDKTKKYGISKKSEQPVFFTDQWHHVTLEVRLNTPGKPDGSARVLVDNKEVINTRDVVFREDGGPDTMIQQFLFNTFHGGHTPAWAPVDDSGKPTTVYAYFDNFLIAEGIQPSPADDDRKATHEE